MSERYQIETTDSGERFSPLAQRQIANEALTAIDAVRRNERLEESLSPRAAYRAIDVLVHALALAAASERPSLNTEHLIRLADRVVEVK